MPSRTRWAELLEIAEKLRAFARETGDRRYFDLFRRGAVQLEIEALGWAASSAVGAAIRESRRRRTGRHNSI
jgi:hypothetical protein